MDAQTEQRVQKRSSYACSRCRRHKIKCSGLQPCERCIQRRQTCIFDDRDNKIMVTRGYLSDLIQKVSRLENAQTGDTTGKRSSGGVESQGQRNVSESSQFDNVPPAERISEQDDGNSLSGDTLQAEDPELTNPLTATPSRYLSASNGKAFYLGTSSNWSFSRRVLTAAHEHVHQSPLPTESLLFDGCAYELDLHEAESPPFDNRAIPSIDYAMYLINAVKFHCCQLFHLFEEDEFIANLHNFYAKFSHRQLDESGLWYIHFLLILAFGKSLVQRKNDTKRPSGVHFFIRAIQLLPDAVTLGRESIMSSEILCCIAWYYQALDFRHAAHNLINQAKSVAMNHGMHTDMPVPEFGEKVVWRCRKIWWTIYVMDRQMTSLMGLPQSLRDEGISCQLPTYPESAQRTAACSMQIRLTQIFAEISTTIYGAKGQLNKDFVISTRAVLESIAGVADELSTAFPLHADDRFDGISRLVAQLHLLYYQCIVLATRPLLLCCFIKRFEAPLEVDSLVASPKVRNLMQMCVESSQQIVNILDCLRAQDLLETFLPLDLDPLFGSTVVLFMARAVDLGFAESGPQWLGKSTAILEEMIGNGNRIAAFRKWEIEKLKELIDDFLMVRRPTVCEAGGVQPEFAWNRAYPSAEADHSPIQPIVGAPLCQNAVSLYSGVDRDGQVDELTADQVMAAAISMNWDDIEWSFTAENS